MSDDVQALLGWDADELQGTCLLDLIHPNDLHTATELAERLDEGHPVGLVCRFRTASGGYRTIDGFAWPVIGPDGVLQAFLDEWIPHDHQHEGLHR